MHGATLATAWKVFLGVVVPVKVVIFGVGYLAWLIGTPSAHRKRESILEHIDATLTTETARAQGLDAKLKDDVAHLEARAEAGWREYADLLALARVVRSLSMLHASETSDVLSEFKAKAWENLSTKLQTMMNDTPRHDNNAAA